MSGIARLAIQSGYFWRKSLYARDRESPYTRCGLTEKTSSFRPGEFHPTERCDVESRLQVAYFGGYHYTPPARRGEVKPIPYRNTW